MRLTANLILLLPGALVFHQTTQPVSLSNPGLWWRWTMEADWQHPEGTNSSGMPAE